MNALAKLVLFPLILRLWGLRGPFQVGMFLALVGVVADRLIVRRYGNGRGLAMGLPFMYATLRTAGQGSPLRAGGATLVMGLVEGLLHAWLVTGRRPSRKGSRTW
ncbi:MAG: hypothetical protein L5657_06005 [Calditerricola sp.]|nr:hypothetical protein [Bacillota bacterium]MCG0314193.1 hypothetical protein [Calditerricola sp.]